MYNKKTGKYEGYIYLVTNDFNDKVYVGQTITSIKRRWSSHICDAKHIGKYKKRGRSYLHLSMNEHGIEHFKISEIAHVIKDTREELKDRLNELQIDNIIKYNSQAPNGYNLTAGGDNFSDSLLAPVVAYNVDKTVWKTFKSITEACQQTGMGTSGIIACCKGRTQLCKGRVWRYAQDSYDKYPTDKIIVSETIGTAYISGTAKMVDQYTLDGEFVKTYNSVSEAARQVGCGSSGINQCCLGHTKQVSGFFWRFHDEPLNKYETDGYIIVRQVDKYTIDGRFVQTYENEHEAAKEIAETQNKYLDTVARCICRCCSGQEKIAYSFVFRFHGDDFDKYSTHSTEYSAVNMYTMDNVFEKQFRTMKEAAQYLGKSNTAQIARVCKKENKHGYGHHWFYADDPANPDKSQILHEYNSRHQAIYDMYEKEQESAS